MNEDEIKNKLTPEEYHVLREKGTEAPFSGELLHEKRSGTYVCKVCGNPLFPSDAKFDSGTGWPSFDQALPGSTKLIQDTSHGMSRTEVVCAKCSSHLGHVFDDGPTSTGKRYCLNSVCLELAEKDISSLISENAELILSEIKKADRILLHCHPSPDPDSVCSALAMKSACEQLGKKAVIIRGDSPTISEGFKSFPGVDNIIGKSFSEVDLKDFDLFISLDSGGPDRVSFKNPPVFPLPIRSINIDHHVSNEMFADINLVPTCVSTTYILYQLFVIWGIKIDHDMALNLFIGLYTDSGGLKYNPIDYKVFQVAANLVKIAPDFTDAIFTMDNSNHKEAIYFEALALNSIEKFLNDNIVISSISYKQIQDNKINLDSIHTDIPNKLKSVIGWNVGMTLVERGPKDIKVSMRSRDAKKFDVSKLAVALGGGGHRAAAGIRFSNTTLEEAKEKIVSKAKELYNL